MEFKLIVKSENPWFWLLPSERSPVTWRKYCGC